VSDRINCRNCIHFNDLEHRCCLNDGKTIKRECYFTLTNRKPKGKDVVIEKLKQKIAELEKELEKCNEIIDERQDDIETLFLIRDELEKKLMEQPKQIIEKIVEKYNLNRKPIIDNFGNVAFGYATINADKLKEFLNNLLKEYGNEN